MARSGLIGPFALQRSAVDAQVNSVSPGTYALGKTENDEFYVWYVGRSDTDLNAQLKQHADDAAYREFKYGYQPSAKAAFEKECHLYHDFIPPDNDVHPAAADGTWKCPRCKQYG